MLENGYKVRVLSRSAETAKKLWPNEEVEVFIGDLTAHNAILDRFLSGIDFLFHCAGEVRETERMFQTNVIGTENLVSAARSNVRHWIQLSSVGAYGPIRSGVVIETNAENPVGIYEETKTESDHLVTSAGSRGDLSFTVLRPSTVFGSGMANRSLFDLISAIYRRIFFFVGKQGASANYIHVDNVVEALMKCMKPQARNQIFIISDHRKLEDFVAIVSKHLNQSPPGLRIPEAPIRLCARLLGKIRGFPLTESRVDALTNRTEYISGKIKSDLGYTHIISMEKGLFRLVQTWKRKRSQTVLEV